MTQHDQGTTTSADLIPDIGSTGRPLRSHRRFRNAASLAEVTSLTDMRWWPTHGVALAYVLIVLAAIVSNPGGNEGDANQALPAQSASTDANGLPVDHFPVGIDLADAARLALADQQRPARVQPVGRPAPAAAPAEASASAAMSDARPLIDYTMPATI